MSHSLLVPEPGFQPRPPESLSGLYPQTLDLPIQGTSREVGGLFWGVLSSVQRRVPSRIRHSSASNVDPGCNTVTQVPTRQLLNVAPVPREGLSPANLALQTLPLHHQRCEEILISLTYGYPTSLRFLCASGTPSHCLLITALGVRCSLSTIYRCRNWCSGRSGCMLRSRS